MASDVRPDTTLLYYRDAGTGNSEANMLLPTEPERRKGKEAGLDWKRVAFHFCEMRVCSMDRGT